MPKSKSDVKFTLPNLENPDSSHESKFSGLGQTLNYLTGSNYLTSNFISVNDQLSFSMLK